MVSGRNVNFWKSAQRGTPVLEELWDESGPKRCAIVEKVPTGSYQATLSRIGLSYVGFRGFPFGLIFSEPFFCLVCGKTSSVRCFFYGEGHVR